MCMTALVTKKSEVTRQGGRVPGSLWPRRVIVLRYNCENVGVLVQWHRRKVGGRSPNLPLTLQVAGLSNSLTFQAAGLSGFLTVHLPFVEGT